MAKLLLRLGLALVFLYAAIASLLNPADWIGFIPSPLRSNLTLTVFSFYEIALALWLLLSKKSIYPPLLAALTLLLIILTNLGALDIVFRDIAIFLAALPLVVLNKQ